MYPLLKMPKTAHLYKEDSTFKKVMMLYRFDKKLRLLMFNEIEKIEIAIRRAVMQITADMTGKIDLKALGFPQGWETEPLWR